MAHTRFGMTWKWEGQECVLQSRCTDEIGQVQPTKAQLAKFFNQPPDYYHTHGVQGTDRKSTRLNSSHSQISYAVFCLEKKTRHTAAEYYVERGLATGRG